MNRQNIITWNNLLLLLLLSHFSRVRLCAIPWTAAHQAPPSLGSPGKNTGVGCHFLLQCMKVKSESEAAQSCPTLSDPMDCSLPGSCIHGIFQVRVLEWVAIAFSGNQDCWERNQQPHICRWYHFNGRNWRGTEELLDKSKRVKKLA